MGRQMTLILGGARSGKSTYAENLAREQDGSVLYVATAIAFDEEMRVRIARHKMERPSHWHTLEAPTQTGAAITPFVQEHMHLLSHKLSCRIAPL